MLGVILGVITAAASAAISLAKSITVIGLAIEGFKLLGNALMFIGKALGIITPEREIDELGDKALQAEEDGITPEKYDSYAEYVKAVDAYETDPEKSNLIPEEKKIEKGIELTAGITIEKFPDFPIEQYYSAIGKNPEYFNEERIKKFSSLILDNKEDELENILNYMDGSEKNDAKISEAMNVLSAIERELYPEISDDEITDNVLDARKQD